MKKLLVLLLTAACALCLAFAVAGCKPDGGESSGGTNTQQGETGGTEETGSGSEETDGEHVHNYGDLIPEKPATCAEEGLQAHYYCEGCRTYFDGEKQEIKFKDLTIPAGHILEENQVVCKTCGVQLAESLTFELKSDDTYNLTSGTPTSDGKIMIPKTYNGLPVTSIDDEAFRDCTNLTSVTIGNSVTEIGYNAFAYCTNLTSITIGDGITFIGERAFVGTAYYNNQDNWTNGVLYIGNYLIEAKNTLSDNYEIKEGTRLIAYGAFSGCTSLTSITIPNSVTSIGYDAFSGCTYLESITVYDDNQTYSSQNGILYNKDKTEFIHIPRAIKGSVTIPDSVNSIGNNAFWNCYNLTSVTIGNSVTEIGYSAFAYCASLASITIPDSVTSIGGSAFYNCKNLTSVTIGNSVTEIGYSAFSGCASLASIIIPDSVTSIGETAFYNCTSLTNVKFENPDGWYCTQNSWATSGTDIKSEDLQKPETAATYLKSTYRDYYWKRKTA